MEAVVLVIHLIVALGIIAVVLIQPAESGGFLGSSGSMSNMMAPRRSADVMTRITTILAGIFFLTSLSLAIIAEHRGADAPKSILDVATEQPAASTAPAQPLPNTAADPAKPAKNIPAKKEKPSAPISK